MAGADRQRRYHARQKAKLERFERNMEAVARLAEDIIAYNRLGLRGSVADHAHALLGACVTLARSHAQSGPRPPNWYSVAERDTANLAPRSPGRRPHVPGP